MKRTGGLVRKTALKAKKALTTTKPPARAVGGGDSTGRGTTTYQAERGGRDVIATNDLLPPCTPDWIGLVPAFNCASAESRFARKVAVGPVSEYRPDLGPCLIFQGRPKDNGYGQFTYAGKNGYAHRYAWERVNGPIPADLTVDHLCRVRLCVEVAHFELVDAVTNYRRGVAARRYCSSGLHPLPVEERPGDGSRGSRRCLPCLDAQRKRGNARRTNSAKGLPNQRIKHDQEAVTAAVEKILAGELRISDAARDLGCNPNYLGRRAWETRRAEVLSRDWHACLICGRPAVEVHHRTPRGIGSTRSADIAYGFANLMSVCKAHHRELESYRTAAESCGYIVRRPTDPQTVPVWGQHSDRWIRLHPDGSLTPVDLPPPASERAWQP